MKFIVLILATASIFSCSRNSDFLNTVKPPEIVIQQTPAPTEPPVPPVHSDKVYNLPIASSSDFIPEVNILWVIDNSGSMGPYQQMVIQNTQLFMQSFKNSTKLKWKMGLISTDESQQPFLGFTPSDVLDYNVADPVTPFQAAVTRESTTGSDVEKTYGPVLNALRNYPSFLMPNAYFALVVVTDEEEQTTDGPIGLPMATTKFISQLATLVGGKNHIATYGIFMTEESCPLMPGFLYATSRWKQMIDQTKGKTYKLCDQQFGQVLANLGQDLIQTILTLHPVITLDAHPIASTIKVRYNNVWLKPGYPDLGGGQWVYDPVANIVTITDQTILDGKNPNIEVTFDIDPNYTSN